MQKISKQVVCGTEMNVIINARVSFKSAEAKPRVGAKINFGVGSWSQSFLNTKAKLKVFILRCWSWNQ